MFSGQKNFANIVNYIPGFVVLVFGMLALHSSVRLIDEYERTYSLYNIDNETVYSLQMWLYWSVIAIGLSGFLLAVMNTDKLHELKRVNKEKKETLQLLENRLTAMEATRDGIGIVDKEGNLVYMNKALMELHGIRLEDMPDYIGCHWGYLYAEKGRNYMSREVMPELEEHSFWQGKTPILRKTGEMVQAELSLTRLPDGGFIGMARDVTAQDEADKEKEELQEQFYQAQKMEAIGRLAGGIAHDFNNILAAMNGYAEFLLDDLAPDSAQHQFAQNILQAGLQAHSLVDQILAFSRREGADLRRMDLVHPLRESLSMLQASLPKTIEVVSHIDMESAQIMGNTTQMSQLIMNLCVNAKDAMEDDRGTLHLSLKKIKLEEYQKFEMVGDSLPSPTDHPLVRIENVSPGRSRLLLGRFSCVQDYVCLRVSDSGSGMSRVIMEHIFEPFFTTKPVEQGTGLGLATVHGVVAAHRGAMIIDSTIGQGTSFEIFVPILQDDELAQTIQAQPPQEVGEGGRVLLVEDQKNVSDMMMRMLQRLGYEAQFAVTGLDALDVLRENPGAFDLVITDQNMPKMTGLELVVQAHMDFPDLPFILLSGYSEEKLQGLMKEHPAIRAILRKPVTKSVLDQQIKDVLSVQEVASCA